MTKGQSDSLASSNQRIATAERRTKETAFRVTLNLDGEGKFDGSCGIPFFEHMLNLLTCHGFFNLKIDGKGDIEVDPHHTVEDIGILMGQAFKKAIGDMKGIVRFGEASVPLEEALGKAVVDICNRPFLSLTAQFAKDQLGNFDTELVEDFFRAFAMNGGFTLHLVSEYGRNTHHIIETLFKSAGRALGQAIKKDPRIKSSLTTKGIL